MESLTRQFRAMGTDCQVSIYGDPRTASAFMDAGVARIELLEDCWSRFRPMSELNRLNARAGAGPVEVSDDLLELVATMQVAWEMTDGLFDPTVLASMRTLGYDADFATVIARGAVDAVVAPSALQRAPGMAGVVIDEEARTISLPAGIGLDPGAIGKGLAADVIVDELMDAGADGVLVSLGGDIVFAGQPGDDPQWLIAVVDERQPADSSDRILRTIEFEPGIDRAAVATSTTLKRRWGNGRHHLVDPRTGDMAVGELVQATVIADFGWQAEACATAALLLGAENAQLWLDERDLLGLLATSDDLVGAHRG